MKKTYLSAINEALSHEMERDDRVAVIGEDVGVYGGGAGATKGLIDKFGARRVMDMPISETAFSGAAVGAAILGMRVVTEIMFSDFMTLVSDPIINHAAKLPFMSAGQIRVPIVIITPMGSGTGAAAQHSQSPEAMFLNTPGIKVVAPSNAHDAKGILISAIRDDSPVIFFEHKLLYDEACEVPDEEYTVPLGKAKTVRQGNDITIIGYSAMTGRCLEAARMLEDIGISAEVIDLVSLKPLDTETIINSVNKTAAALVVTEAPKFGAFSAQIASVIAENCFSSLRAPVSRLGGREIPIAYNSDIERWEVPDAKQIMEKAEEIYHEKI